MWFSGEQLAQLLDRLECVLNPVDDTESGAKESVKLVLYFCCTQRELENATCVASAC